MPRGAPDYSNVTGGEPAAGFYDRGEMAARLGSPVVYDKAGILVWYTDFEHGLQGITFGVDHADSVGSLTAERACHGAFSIKLDPRDAVDSYVEWRRIAYFLPVGNIGFELSLSLEPKPDNFHFIIKSRDGAYVLNARMNYYTATGNWEIRKADGTYVTILTGFELQYGVGSWHPIKLVIDTKNEKYVRALIGRNVIDLSDYGVEKAEDDTLAQLEVGVAVYGSAAAHAPVYVDSVIVTQNEP